jgi:hypothetical protein
VNTAFSTFLACAALVAVPGIAPGQIPSSSFTASSSSSSDPAAAESNPLPDAPSVIPHRMIRANRPPLAVASHTRPFSTVAIGLTLGTGGVGVEIATPLNTRFNLRGGVGFLDYTTSFKADNVPVDGTLHLGNIHAGVDWFFSDKHSFHISPGVTFFNHSNYNALIHIAPNSVITLNDQDYTSDPNDPIHGTALISFGSKFSPRLTAGFGNMIPHKDKNITFPMEFGFQYIKRPTADFRLAGSSCDSDGDCGPIATDPDAQANLLEEQNEIIHDLAPLRFFPIIQFGIAYKFGH